MMTMNGAEELFNWNWFYWHKGDSWYAPCPRCGAQEMIPSQSEETLDQALRDAESTHICGGESASLAQYDEHYGMSDLKKFVGFPQELV